MSCQGRGGPSEGRVSSRDEHFDGDWTTVFRGAWESVVAQTAQGIAFNLAANMATRLKPVRSMRHNGSYDAIIESVCRFRPVAEWRDKVVGGERDLIERMQIFCEFETT